MANKPVNVAKIEITLPDWTERFLPWPEKVFPDVKERMELVIALARANIENKTGGPFGAAIFDMETNRLISVGMNLVETTNCSVLHAEVVAIILAQKRLGNYDLGANAMPSCELITSVEPCAMCLGAIPWSGIKRVVCGARDEDARSIGFDEGDKPAEWINSLEKRGIEVVRDICRKDAAKILSDYQSLGGLIYNSGSGGQ